MDSTTRGFLAAIKQRHGLKTDGDLHRLLNVSRERISRYQKGQDYFGEEIALKVAAALDLTPGYVLACVAAERAKSDEVKAAWRKVAATAGALVVALAIGAELEYSAALVTVADAPSLYIMSNALWVILIALAALAAIRDRSHTLTPEVRETLIPPARPLAL